MADKKAIQAKNHPKKGDSIKVEPIRKLKDIATIKKILSDKPQDLAYFILGINTNLRASDILKLKVSQVKDVPANGDFELAEQKTGKKRRVTLNENCVKAITAFLKVRKDKTDYLFEGQRGVWTVSYANAKVKSWAKQINLKGNYGSHSLRKTWGYHQRVTFGRDLPTLVKCFSHATQKQTLDYLCIQDSEIKDVFASNL